jgi:hexosaminidase
MRNLLVFLLLGANYLSVYSQTSMIIPQPVEIVYNEGEFVIDQNTSIKFNASNTNLKQSADFLKNHLKSISGVQLSTNVAKKKSISLKILKSKDLGDEGYKLSVTAASITITANGKAGIIYGLQTLFQTLPAIRTNASLSIPNMEVTDYPRFKYRGMHLDVSRHFFSPDLVKEYIDQLASYKINTFHWHLVDDQGWRIEIKKYPLLTKVGAWRVDHNDIIWGSRPQAKEGEVPSYGGYYTQSQIKEIIKYASDRNVTIIPEIELPGHVASAIAAYPALSCNQIPQLPLTGENYTDMSSNYCAGNDSVFVFLENVLSEVIALFPSKYIHIGGDEVDKTPWSKCSKCNARKQAEHLHDEEELQSYFIKRIEKFVNSKNRKIIGWDEILEGGLAPTATVMSWRGESGGIKAAKMKHDVIMTPGFPLYFDHYQAGPEGEPQAIGGMNTLKSVYDYNPIPKELTTEDAKYVLGAQANLWTEYITTNAQVEYMVIPRMVALAEAVWSPLSSKDWSSFNARLEGHFKKFDQFGINYSKGNFNVSIKPTSDKGQLTVALGTEVLNGKIHYTTDGLFPNLSSPLYSIPLNMTSTSTIKAISVKDSKVLSLLPSEQTFEIHKAIGKQVNYKFPISNSYKADGMNSLTDGVRGKMAVGKYWHGISGADLVATIDLESEAEVSTISLGCLQHYKDWIFMPSEVKFEMSRDGQNFEEIITLKNQIARSEKSGVIYDFAVKLDKVKLRYIRISAKNGVCPVGHPGEGKPSWIFADEIIVK